jgi:RHH-type transcriptional regulator, rel operon repressor / antitoxin RelB
MSGSTTAAKPRADLVERIGDLARETGSTPEELEAAAREYAEHERWKAAMVREALDELEVGAPGVPNEEVMRWLESWGTDHELPPPEPPAKP